MSDKNFHAFLEDVASGTPEAKDMLHEFYMVMYNQPYSPGHASDSKDRYHGDPDDISEKLKEFFVKYKYPSVRSVDMQRLHFVRRDVEFIGQYGPGHKY